MNRLAPLLLSLCLVCVAKAEVDAQALLFAEPQEAFLLRKIESIRSSGGKQAPRYQAEYCHGERCDIFTVRYAGSYKPAADFFLLYALYFSRYPNLVGTADLDEYVGKTDLPPMPLIAKHGKKGSEALQGYRDQCSQASEDDNALCVLRHLCAKHAITLTTREYYKDTFTREFYGPNMKVEVETWRPPHSWVDLCPELTRERLEAAKAWRQKWQESPK